MGKPKSDAVERVPKVETPDDTLDTSTSEISGFSTESSGQSEGSDLSVLEVKRELNETAETSSDHALPVRPPVKKLSYPRYSKSKRAALSFPVTRMRNKLRQFNKNKMRVGETAAVYAAAVVEYLVAEVLELAGNAAKENRRTRVTPRNICLAVKTDEELNSLLSTSIMPDGGVVPNIHTALLPKKKGRAESE